jgi:exonuclease SbcC
MIPLHLTLSGFLSYRDQVELDFSGLDLACIAGSNGAGKSSLLDAITWSLFGQARKRDDSLINSREDLAEVSFIFSYESNLYRVLRTKQRNKTTQLEFHILSKDPELPGEQFDWRSGSWKPLTERTLRDTEARIQETLRLDYETFVNASFFLQGNADQFTQQRPGDRKRILANILGLEIWDVYRQRAGDQRRAIESDIQALEGRMQEINAELDEEASRVERLGQLESELKELSDTRAGQEATLENIRQITATLKEQERLVEILARQYDRLHAVWRLRKIAWQSGLPIASHSMNCYPAVMTSKALIPPGCRPERVLNAGMRLPPASGNKKYIARNLSLRSKLPKLPCFRNSRAWRWTSLKSKLIRTSCLCWKRNLPAWVAA